MLASFPQGLPRYREAEAGLMVSQNMVVIGGPRDSGDDLLADLADFSVFFGGFGPQRSI